MLYQHRNVDITNCTCPIPYCKSGVFAFTFKYQDLAFLYFLFRELEGSLEKILKYVNFTYVRISEPSQE